MLKENFELKPSDIDDNIGKDKEKEKKLKKAEFSIDQAVGRMAKFNEKI